MMANEKLIQSTQIIRDTPMGQVRVVKLSAAGRRGLSTGGNRIRMTTKTVLPPAPPPPKPTGR